MLVDSIGTLRAALTLVFASAAAYEPCDPQRAYTPKDREPYDALADRCLRGRP